MKKSLLLILPALIWASCSQKPAYEITGTVSAPDANGKYVYLSTYPYSEETSARLDSALIQNGTFTLKGTTDTPALRVLVAPSDQEDPATAVFLLENASLTASLGPDASVTGTPENDAYYTWKKESERLTKEINSLAPAFNSTNAAVSEPAKEKLKELSNTVQEKNKTYIQTHLDQPLGAVALYSCRYGLGEEEQNELLAQASPAFKAVPGIDKMLAHLDVLKKVSVGKKFLDFEMADMDGKTHSLSEYVGNGKITLIDFWASWCPPCRREMPNLVAAYKQYKNKGFEIVGVSLDSKAADWAKGVKDLGITWPQLSDLQGWKNAGAQLYGVNSIPHTVLVDQNGTIIAKNLHGDELDAKLKEAIK